MRAASRSSVVAALLISLVSVFGGAGVAFAQDTPEDSDDRARVSFVESIIDSDGELWLKIGFHTPWAEIPPHDLFSFFFFLDVQVDGEFSAIGWQIHDGESNVIADGTATEDPEIYILGDGCVLVATGLHPTKPFTATVIGGWGSWIDEINTVATSGST